MDKGNPESQTSKECDHDHSVGDYNKQLLEAGKKGHLACIAGLLKVGADVNTQDEENTTPLMHAATDGYDHCVEHLLEAGAGVEKYNNKKFKSLDDGSKRWSYKMRGSVIKSGS